MQYMLQIYIIIATALIASVDNAVNLVQFLIEN
jgi:hypothetical protein